MRAQTARTPCRRRTEAVPCRCPRKAAEIHTLSLSKVWSAARIDHLTTPQLTKLLL